MRNLPALSVLIPARNEAGVIASTVQALLSQDYPDFEIIILDDHSSDNTTELALTAAGGDRRLRVLPGANLPPGWLGKNWACQQLSQAARLESEWLLFSDADVRWQPGALQALVLASQDLHADMATVWPTQITHTWAERLVVPLMAQAIIGYLPLLAVHYLPLSIFAAANGQCLLFRRSAYQAVGEHASVYDSVIEDVSLARRTKKLGYNLRMLDGDRLVACRMYTSWAGVRDGFAKNILAGSRQFLALPGRIHFSPLAGVYYAGPVAGFGMVGSGMAFRAVYHMACHTTVSGYPGLWGAHIKRRGHPSKACRCAADACLGGLDDDHRVPGVKMAFFRRTPLEGQGGWQPMRALI